MKKLIVLCIALVSSQLHAEWKKPSQDHSLNSAASAIVNPHLRFTVAAQYIYRSTDQGQTWQKDSFGLDVKNNYVQQQYIQFSDENNGFIFTVLYTNENTYKSSLFRTTDQGRTWTEIPTDVSVDYNSKLHLCEYQWFIISRDRIILSENEGKTWHDYHHQMPDSVIMNLNVLDANTWFMITNNTDGNMPSIFRSTDHGNHWTLIKKFDFSKDSVSMSMIFPGDFQIVDNHIYLVLNVYYPGCGFYYDHSLFYHLEYQYGWQTHTMPEMRLSHISRILFISGDTAYALSDNTIYKTTDGGKTWFATFGLNYENGPFTNLQVIDGILTASTSKGIVVINENSNDDINLSVKNPKPSIEILVYPNPAGDQLNIRLPEITANCDYSLMNETGQTVLNSTCQNCSLIEINTSGLARGIYIYTIHSGSTKTRGKIILR